MATIDKLLILAIVVWVGFLDMFEKLPEPETRAMNRRWRHTRRWGLGSRD